MKLDPPATTPGAKKALLLFTAVSMILIARWAVGAGGCGRNPGIDGSILGPGRAYACHNTKIEGAPCFDESDRFASLSMNDSAVYIAVACHQYLRTKALGDFGARLKERLDQHGCVSAQTNVGEIRCERLALAIDARPASDSRFLTAGSSRVRPLAASAGDGSPGTMS